MEMLYESAAKGDVVALRKLLQEDEFLLERVSYTSPNNTPLHVAALKGYLLYVVEILSRSPRLAEVLNSQQSSPLHIASARGYVEIAKRLIGAAPDMCLSRDSQQSSPLHIASARGYVEIAKSLIGAAPDMCLSRDSQGRNPVHLAAIKGRVQLLEELVSVAPLAARHKVGRGLNALHLCVEHGQLGALRVLMGEVKELINAKNDDGDTILHMAVAGRKTEIIEYLLQNDNVDIKAMNSNGQTAKSLYEQIQPEAQEDSGVAHVLCHGLNRSKNKHRDTQPVKWLTKKRDSIMVVAILIATMAFQAGVTPPGGFWQEDFTHYDNGTAVDNPHKAGEAVMAYKSERAFKNFMRTNTVAFVTSLSTILLLISGLPFRRPLFMWILMVTMWLTVTTTAATYAISITVVTPKKDRRSLSDVIEISLAVWCGVMLVLLVGNTIRLIDKWLKKRGVVVWRPRRFRREVEMNQLIRYSSQQ
ncbi:ankyrin repeat-containing protein ITN1-like [Salvia splendens]|uniref:ankyrin repeat-containing protein ITN1-like n=1 Tax=Salvia splendens TaxID=180675 RepID=UPI0011006B4D|nr:ankyrin repeat-containing protein ITN1-like [Salvia splendens]